MCLDGEPVRLDGRDVGDVPPAEVQRGERLEDKGLCQQGDAPLLPQAFAGPPGEEQAAVEVADDEARPTECSRERWVRGVLLDPLRKLANQGCPPVEWVDQGVEDHDPGVSGGQAENSGTGSHAATQRFLCRTPVARHGGTQQQICCQVLLSGAACPVGGLDQASYVVIVTGHAIVESTLEASQPSAVRRIERQDPGLSNELVHRLASTEFERQLC